MKSKETVILYGQENDPAIQATKKRIEECGRSVVITDQVPHDACPGICGQHCCTCTVPCKSFKYKTNDNS